MYGAESNVGFRYYDLRMASAITLTGQVSNRHLEVALNDYMNKLLKTSGVEYAFYGDTDSNFLNVDALVQKMFPDGASNEKITRFLDKFAKTELQKVVNKSIDDVFNMTTAYEKLMGSKREVIASKCLFTTKKRYAMMMHNKEGVDYSPYKMKIMGLDMIKTSTPKWVRGKLKEALILMFEKGEVELRRFVAETRETFYNLAIEEVSFPKSVNDIDKWKGTNTLYIPRTPIHVRASMLYNSLPNNAGAIRNGDKIKYAYLVEPNPIKENIIGFPTDGSFPPALLAYIDRELQWDKAFLSPLKSLTDAIKWELVERSTLDSFFV